MKFDDSNANKFKTYLNSHQLHFVWNINNAHLAVMTNTLYGGEYAREGVILYAVFWIQKKIIIIIRFILLN